MTNRCANPANAWRPIALGVLLGFLTLSAIPFSAAERKVKLPRESRRSDTRAIESMEQQWRTAIVNGDVAVMDKLLSDDFLAISARGTLSDKQQYLHRVSTHATQFSTFDLVDLKVRVQSGSAVAVSQAHIEGVLEGRPIEGTFRYTKVYVRGAGGTWRITNFEATRVATAASVSDMDQGLPLSDHPNRHSSK